MVPTRKIVKAPESMVDPGLGPGWDVPHRQMANRETMPPHREAL
jgi:hypothetical protein